RQATGHGLAVEQHRAGAANPDPARLAYRQQAVTAQRRQQHLVAAGLERRGAAVEEHVDLHRSSASRTPSAVIGSSVTCTPSEASALPIAGGIGGSAVSPSPWTSAPSLSISSCVSF